MYSEFKDTYEDRTQSMLDVSFIAFCWGLCPVDRHQTSVFPSHKAGDSSVRIGVSVRRNGSNSSVVDHDVKPAAFSWNEAWVRLNMCVFFGRIWYVFFFQWLRVGSDRLCVLRKVVKFRQKIVGVSWIIVSVIKFLPSFRLIPVGDGWASRDWTVFLLTVWDHRGKHRLLISRRGRLLCLLTSVWCWGRWCLCFTTWPNWPKRLKAMKLCFITATYYIYSWCRDRPLQFLFSRFNRIFFFFSIFHLTWLFACIDSISFLFLFTECSSLKARFCTIVRKAFSFLFRSWDFIRWFDECQAVFVRRDNHNWLIMKMRRRKKIHVVGIMEFGDGATVQ